MKVLNFNEYIKEGFLSKTLGRSNTGEKRLEDKTLLDDMCKFIGECMAKKMKIEYSPDLCTYERNEDDSYHEEAYYIRCNFEELASEYSDIVIDFVPEKHRTISEYKDFEELSFDMFYTIDQFQDSGFEYEDYEDPYMSSKRQFNKIKKIFQYIVDELGKI